MTTLALFKLHMLEEEYVRIGKERIIFDQGCETVLDFKLNGAGK